MLWGDVFLDDFRWIRAVLTLLCACSCVFPAVRLVVGGLLPQEYPEMTWGGARVALTAAAAGCERHRRRRSGAKPGYLTDSCIRAKRVRERVSHACRTV